MANYEKGKVGKAMALAPLGAVVGLLPFLVFLNLSVGQWLAVIALSIVLSYVAALIIGGIGYFVLKKLGFEENKYLYAYAGTLVLLVAIAYADFYAFVSFAPPVFLATAAFCYFRGKPVG
ncbi:MAG: hypothetical protein GKR90_16400 [Pseudomonadales bacterium]|nr:hypothetical protein [Pseudomonadales bacterium]